jgi:hypothetical protein
MIYKKFFLKILYSIFFALLIMLLIKIDFRLVEEIPCCGDDYDYFLHAETIAIDGNLSFKDQNLGEFKYTYNDIEAPVGFFGSGFLASPFLFIGNALFGIFEMDAPISLFNYKIVLYSIAPIFYIFCTHYLIYFSLKHLHIYPNKKMLLVFLFSGGVQYYAFERFSMTHVYEVFGVALILFLSLTYYSSNNKIISILLPISISLGLLVRMSNYYLFLLPVFIASLVQKKDIFLIKRYLRKDIYFYIGVSSAVLLYYFFSQNIYGRLILNPQKIYAPDLLITNFIYNDLSIFEEVISILNSLKVVLFSFEFGILWTNPILFFGLLICILHLRNFYSLILVICFLQNFYIIHIWQSTASSYGFRYLYSLTPMFIIYLLVHLHKQSTIYKLIIIFSFFSLIQYLFFEANLLTQLSTDYQLNSFGNEVVYSSPNYVIGAIKSIFILESYLNIFTTSFLGVFFFKIILTFFGSEQLILLLNSLSLPVYNQDFLDYLDKIKDVNYLKIFLLSFIPFIFGLFLHQKEGENK